MFKKPFSRLKKRFTRLKKTYTKWLHTHVQMDTWPCKSETVLVERETFQMLKQDCPG